jgi:anti-anti-sigma regulatory factor
LIEGEISGNHVAELAHFTETLRARTEGVVLDLSGVSFVDQTGATLLRTLRSRRFELVNASAFVASLVDPPAFPESGGAE